MWDASSQVQASCKADVGKFCSHLKEGGGETVQDCLRGHLEKLSRKCRRSEFKELKDETQSLDLNPRLRRACAKPIKESCSECGVSQAVQRSTVNVQRFRTPQSTTILRHKRDYEFSHH